LLNQNKKREKSQRKSERSASNKSGVDSNIEEKTTNTEIKEMKLIEI
jgi:hypothetical protein